MSRAARCAALAATVALCAAAAAPAAAQNGRPLALEIRGGYTLPVGDLDDFGAESEVGFGADLVVGLSPFASVYAGWGRDQFDCTGCGGDDDIHASGPELGIKLRPARPANIRPWARVGAIYHSFAGELSGLAFESERRVGLQLGAGVDLPLGRVLSVAPSVRFHSWTAEFDAPLGTFETQGGIRYLSFDLVARYLLR